MSTIRFAPTLAHALRRSLLVLLASAALTAVLYWDLGAPTSARMGRRGQRQPYGPSLQFGLGQFAGQTLLFVVGVYVARRWGRVRL